VKTSVLITGGSGLLAVNWALTIQGRYFVTLGLHTRAISIAGIEARELDLESADNFARTVEEIRPSIVIHTVGMTSVEACEADPALAQHVNVDLATNVARACAYLDLPLVHISTDHLFSGEQALVDETHLMAPANVYGRTKAEAESRVLDAHGRAMVIRTNFYGWGPSYRLSFSDIVIDALRSGNEITLFTDVFYTPILIETAVNAVHDLIDLRVSGRFQVVGDDRLSKYEFGLKIAEEFSLDQTMIKPGLLNDQDSLVRRPHDMSLSNQRTCDLLGRELGTVGEGVERLHEQERGGLAQALRSL
jgi:dTDP-4-dehydrorhamnose reductase